MVSESRQTHAPASPADLATLTVKGVSVHFPRTPCAVDDVSFATDHGVLCLLGPNGAGKSTLLSVIAGIRKPNSGSVRLAVLGVDKFVPSKTVASHIGFLPQRFDLDGRMTLLDTVKYAAWCRNVKTRELDSAALIALVDVNLHLRAKQRVKTLSGGERQRLGLACVTVHKPELLILDEPTVGLDPDERVRFRSRIQTLSSSTCIILSTHLLEDCEHTAQRVLIQKNGRLRFEGTISELAHLGAGVKSGQSALEKGYQRALAADR